MVVTDSAGHCVSVWKETLITFIHMALVMESSMNLMVWQ